PPFKPTGKVALSYIDKHVGSNPEVSAIPNASELIVYEFLADTIDVVERDSNWYYIPCSDCQTKVNRGSTSLICPKCINVKDTGVSKYRTDQSSTTMTIRPLLCYLAMLFLSSREGRRQKSVALSYIDKHVGSNPDVSAIPNALEVTKVATMILTVYEFLAGTIDDVERDSNWYYIACSDCQTKVNRGPTSLICPKYRTDLSSTTMTIRPVLCYLAMLTWMGAHHDKPTPQSLVVTMGQAHKFIVKVPDYNFTTKSRPYLSLSLPYIQPAVQVILVRHCAPTNVSEEKKEAKHAILSN
ncbi:hypothetical protein HID58_095354, partial [Brassica napus]